MGALRLNLGVVGDGDVGAAVAVVEAAVRGGVLGVDGDRMFLLILDCGVDGVRGFVGDTLKLLTMVLLIVLVVVLLLLPGLLMLHFLLLLLLLPLGSNEFTPTEVV
jgi:hypothetical protein